MTRRDLLAAVYLPTLVFAVGQGALIPAVPLLAQDLGATTAVAGLVAGAAAFGRLLFTLPAGGAASTWGDRRTLAAGATIIAIAALVAVTRPMVAGLAAALLAMGAGAAFWELARHAIVTDAVPSRFRGRALTSIAGAHRIGLLIGPTLGAFVATIGGLESAFVIAAIAAGLALVTALAWRGDAAGPRSAGEGHLARRMLRAARRERSSLVRAAPPVMVLGALRQSRFVLLPLWGVSIGLDIVAIGLVTTLSFLIDALMFFPVGWAMDRFGRKVVGVPCLVILGSAFLLLPLAGDLTTLAIVSALMGVGNGLGAGMVLTLGADLAPHVDRGEFLGIWRFLSEAGQVAGPIICSAAIALAGLPAAGVVMGLVGLAGAAHLYGFVAETRDRPTPVPDA
jgi:MFS family permease